MSLLDGFLRDALLQNVVQSDVYLGVRSDASANGGAGTVSDPYYAAKPNPTNDPAIDLADAALFDAIMTSTAKIPPGVTVRIGPGTFSTMGGTGLGQGWAVKPGTRLLGSGIAQTSHDQALENRWRDARFSALDSLLFASRPSPESAICGRLSPLHSISSLPPLPRT